MIVKYQKEIEIVNTCGAIYSEEEVRSAIMDLVAIVGKPVQRLKRVYLYGNYPAITIDHIKIHLHRLLMGYKIGHVELATNGMYVHHKNHNKLDARLSNLELIEPSEHQSHHNKGKTISEYQRKRIIESNQTRWIKKFPELYENPDLVT